MIEEIRFHDSGKKINISIDNETQTIPIQAIDKLPTFIELRQSLDTPLYEKILIDADVCYVPYDSAVTNLDNIDEQNTIEDVHVNNSGNDVDTTSTSYIDIDTTQENHIINIDGIVTLTIYKEDNSIYIQKDINFKKGHIQDSIINTLPIGEYYATIFYKGNKYFQQTLLNIVFNVTKRDVNVIFSEENYYGYPTDDITIQAYLKDSITNKPINDCDVKYIFDGHTYATKSNVAGEVFLNITIPDADPSHCLPYINSYEEEQNESGEPYEDEPEIYDFDEDGNIVEVENFSTEPLVQVDTIDSDSETYFLDDFDDKVVDNIDYGYNYPNASYLVELYSDSDAYYIYAMTNVIANKLPTEITINQQSEIENNIVTIGGNAVAMYDNLAKNVRYGQVTVSFEDTDYTNTTPIINNGNFTMDIDFAQINEFNNYTDNTVLVPYPGANGQITSITINKENEGNISIGDAIIISARVQSKADKEAYVQDGMIVFMLYNSQDKEVYRYATEIDHTGQAVFLFNTSKKDTYKVKAHYYGIFGYTDSESNIIENIEVK